MPSITKQKLFEIGAIYLAPPIAWSAFSVIETPLTRDELAMWVQGIGTIAAVGVAAWVGLIPLRLETQRRVVARAQFRAAIIDSVDAAFFWAEILANAVVSKDVKGVHRGIFVLQNSAALRAIEKLLEEPLSTWPTTISFVKLSALSGALADLTSLKVPVAEALYTSANAPFWRDAEMIVRYLNNARVELVQHLAADAAADPYFVPPPPSRRADGG